MIPLKLLEAVDPSMSPPWNGMGMNYAPISLDEVMASDLAPLPLCGGDGDPHWLTRAEHTGRIRWLIENGWSDPIEIKLTNYIWPIADGNHRLAAAFLCGHVAIPATVEGEDDDQVARFLSGSYKLEAM